MQKRSSSRNKSELVRLEEKAEAFEAEKNHSRAAALWGKLAKLRPNVYYLCRYGDSLLAVGNLERAINVFMSAMELNNRVPYPVTRLGIAYIELGEPEKAEHYLKKSLALEENARVLTLFAVAQFQRGRIEEARESLMKAIELDPSYEEAYFNLGLTAIDNDVEAQGHFAKALELDPGYACAHRELGWSLSGSGKFEKAIGHLRKALELEDQDLWTYVYLGNTLWMIGRADEAEDFFTKAVKSFPDSSTAYWCLAFFHERCGNSSEAGIYYERSLKLNRDDLLANLRFGLFLMQSGQLDKAKSYLTRALFVDPENPLAKRALSQISRQRRRRGVEGSKRSH